MLWISGITLCDEDQQKVQRMYVHRFTGTHRPAWAGPSSRGRQQYKPRYLDDDEWLLYTDFAIRKDRRLDMRIKHCFSNLPPKRAGSDA